MSSCRLWGLALTGLVALLGIGCQTPPREIERLVTTDSFGMEEEEITDRSVQQFQMFRQRAQLELKLGGSFPWDPFDASEDSLTDPGVPLGTKFSFEADKNLFLGGSFDWVRHDVETPSSPAATEPVQFMESYDRFTFLVGADYDIPLSEGELPLLLRIGGFVGLLLVQPNDRFSDPRVETYLNFVARPSVGLRYPLDRNILIFLEGSYDFTARRELRTTDDQRIGGSEPIFGTGILWLGVAFEWD